MQLLLLAATLASPQIAVHAIAQEAYVKASNTGPSDRFGEAIAISGDTLVVGAALEASAATGVNGDESSNGLNSSGAAYVFVRSGSTWAQQAYLKASNTQAGDVFGVAVAISGDTIVVGAIGEDSCATGINGDQLGVFGSESGAAYVFVRNGTTWSQQAYLKASNSESGDFFGKSVAVSGDTIVVGAHREASNATGVNGNQADNSAPESGAAYVFVRNGTVWSQEAYLKASNSDAQDFFGGAVAIANDHLVIGAQYEDSNANHVNGNQGNGGVLATDSGAAYIFARSGTTWTQEAYLKASNSGADDCFGLSVGISGETVVVGAPFEASDATGVNGDQDNDLMFKAGAAYVFERDGASWVAGPYLKASNTDPVDHFGWSVAVSGSSICVGSPLEDSADSGVNGDESSNGLLGAGAAYVFSRSAAGWVQHSYLKGSNPGNDDRFALSLALSGNSIAVGSLYEDSSATGIDGDQFNDASPDSGAAYVFRQESVTSYCAALPNSTGMGCTLTSSGSVSIAQNSLQLIAGDCVPDQPGIFFYGQARIQVPFGNGVRCVAGAGSRLFPFVHADSAGVATYDLNLAIPPAASGAGQVTPGVWNFQFWYRDPAAGGAGSNLSDGLSVLFIP